MDSHGLNGNGRKARFARKKSLVGFFATVFVVFCVFTSLAGASDGSMSGTVTDPAHAVVANVPLVITNTKTGKKIGTKTGPAGGFGPIPLSLGEYRVEINARCFKSYSKIIEVADGQALHLDIALEVSRANDCRTE
jgi:Carboxypeptidase regulatory-like domain